MSTKKETKFQTKINKKYPQENILVLEYTGAKNFAIVKCLDCGKEYSVERGENLLRKNKVCICPNCFRKIEKYNNFVNKLKDKFPQENLSVENFIDRLSPCDIICNTCGNKIHYNNAAYVLQKNNNVFCRKCHPAKEAERNITKQNFRDFLVNHKEWLLQDDLDDVKFTQNTVACKCLHCGRINHKTMYDYMRGRKCFCQTTTEPKTQEVFKSCLEEDYELLTPYSNIYGKVKIRHKSCGFVYETTARNCWLGKGKCPKCHKKESTGEKQIAAFLDEAKIDYIREYPIRINNHLLRIDFYIPSKNLYIEYQGIQHYEPVAYFGGQERFVKQQEYDKYKRDYLQDNLLIISYKENPKKVLKEKLQSSTTTLS